MDRFRKDYTPLTEDQKALGKQIKEKAEELEALFAKAWREKTGASTREEGEQPGFWEKCKVNTDANRCLQIALTRLEESVMWGVKGAYTEIPVFDGGEV